FICVFYSCFFVLACVEPAAFPIFNRDAITVLSYVFIFQFIAKKKSSQVNEKTFVGVAGFEPAAFPIFNRDALTF
ncbi:hypothetical protein, partial [Flavobacterium panici]|uniref:hypothetical protein n=1 Tax=Flavobacterium panici TaxID=2654843 RepID=UPI001C60F9D2